jgi:hypothetical protein
MRGRFQAAMMAAVSTAMPMMFWLGAAAVVLVTLRKGWAEGVNLMLWAALPAVGWLVLIADPTPLLVVVGAMLLALVLRGTVSWVYTLLVGTGIGLLISWSMPLLVPQLLTPELVAKLAPNVGAEAGEQTYQLLSRLLAGFFGAAHLLVIVLSLMLGRWWQSLLYNPGGFGEEFRQLILPPAAAIPAVLIAQFGGSLHPALVSWAPVIMVPLFFAGIALAHGVVKLKKMSAQWLVLFYLLVFLIGPYVALLDSLMNFRRRIRNST